MQGSAAHPISISSSDSDNGVAYTHARRRDVLATLPRARPMTSAERRQVNAREGVRISANNVRRSERRAAANLWSRVTSFVEAHPRATAAAAAQAAGGRSGGGPQARQGRGDEEEVRLVDSDVSRRPVALKAFSLRGNDDERHADTVREEVRRQGAPPPQLARDRRGGRARGAWRSQSMERSWPRAMARSAASQRRRVGEAGLGNPAPWSAPAP